jgi:hypothetical protein
MLEKEMADPGEAVATDDRRQKPERVECSDKGRKAKQRERRSDEMKPSEARFVCSAR